MNQKQDYMEKMIALLLLLFPIDLLLGEGLRDFLYGEPIPEEKQVPEKDLVPSAPNQKKAKSGKAIPACSSCSDKNGFYPMSKELKSPKLSCFPSLSSRPAPSVKHPIE
jgi:hypothetical protein